MSAIAQQSENTSKYLTPAQATLKARKAFSQAKYRCKNDPSYSSVKFLLASAAELIASCGLPKRSDHSLDRIDPHGHYEIGNLRWASKATQSGNKKAGKFGSNPPVDVYVNEAKQTLKGEALRSATTEAWTQLIAFYNGQIGKRAALQALDAAGIGDILSRNSFELSDIRDEILGPGTFTMPALTEPNQFIVLAGGPFAEASDDGDIRLPSRLHDACRNGCIRGLGRIPLSENAPDGVSQLVERCLNDPTQKGVCWHGRTEAGDFEKGGMEGSMLCAASRLRFMGLSAAIVPGLVALDMLPDAPWETTLHDALEEYLLFIPDFQLDAGFGWSSSHKEVARLSRLVEERAASGLKTFIGVQNPHRLAQETRRMLFRHLTVVEFKASAGPTKPSRDQVRRQARERWAAWPQ